MVGNEFNGIGHGDLPSRFETGFTLVSLVAFVNFVALRTCLAEVASRQHRAATGTGSLSNPFQRVPH
ncbi:hypothetical protein I5154_002749 [Pseudomonas aeruginosa]|nr:hypothetical protein I5154_002749 [Pseudomonas aeruginosa]